MWWVLAGARVNGLRRERSKLVPINGHFRGIARALSAPVPQRAENMLVHIKLLGWVGG